MVPKTSTMTLPEIRGAYLRVRTMVRTAAIAIAIATTLAVSRCAPKARIRPAKSPGS